jgi:hypothetical protein
MKNLDTVMATPMIPKSKRIVPDQLGLAFRAAYRPSGIGVETPWLRRLLLSIYVAAGCWRNRHLKDRGQG